MASIKQTIKKLFPHLGLEYHWLATPMFRYNITPKMGKMA